MVNGYKLLVVSHITKTDVSCNNIVVQLELTRSRLVLATSAQTKHLIQHLKTHQLSQRNLYCQQKERNVLKFRKMISRMPRELRTAQHSPIVHQAPPDFLITLSALSMKNVEDTSGRAVKIFLLLT